MMKSWVRMRVMLADKLEKWDGKQETQGGNLVNYSKIGGMG